MFQLLDKLSTNPLAIVIIFFILAILFISIVASLVIRKKYQTLGQALEEIKKGNINSNSHVLSSIIKEYRNAASDNLEEVNTQAIIEKNFNKHLKWLYIGERFVKSSVSLMIILGLLGTFYGLTLSIGKLVELLNNSTNSEVLNSMDSIVDGLIKSVKGMSVAFLTSLFGIGSSIIITVYNMIFNIEDVRVALMVEVEEYLDNTVASEFNTGVKDQYTDISDTLKTTFEQFGNQINDSFKYVINTSSENLAAATKEIGDSTRTLLHVIQIFEKSVNTFNENTRDFSEFNHELRTNIQRMNIGFSDFTREIKDTVQKISDSVDKLPRNNG
ncbi:MotA/TolQ/ExbB proton channel family protein [Caldisalinibacter kiritimatiensis]|uniref:Uncharacterized protein n=1 Tax=Caldisalinibacter kiritimatiensis TaxID=1304284 RepID=R1CHY7_9FIRM|nr:MotA/TolQ/ExbB proton channel family protein [Caldisalinibacter kiritimatiensis]EOD01895.1 hypothetical protein L21TH_0001 [Caldisalinibacter kiritimatiensis]